MKPRIATGSRQHQSGLRTEEGKQEVHEADEDEDEDEEGEEEGDGDDEDEVEEVGVRKHKRYLGTRRWKLA